MKTKTQTLNTIALLSKQMIANKEKEKGVDLVLAYGVPDENMPVVYINAQSSTVMFMLMQMVATLGANQEEQETAMALLVRISDRMSKVDVKEPLTIVQP